MKECNFDNETPYFIDYDHKDEYYVTMYKSDFLKKDTLTPRFYSKKKQTFIKLINHMLQTKQVPESEVEPSGTELEKVVGSVSSSKKPKLEVTVNNFSQGEESKGGEEESKGGETSLLVEEPLVKELDIPIRKYYTKQVHQMKEYSKKITTEKELIKYFKDFDELLIKIINDLSFEENNNFKEDRAILHIQQDQYKDIKRQTSGEVSTTNIRDILSYEDKLNVEEINSSDIIQQKIKELYPNNEEPF